MCVNTLGEVPAVMMTCGDAAARLHCRGEKGVCVCRIVVGATKSNMQVVYVQAFPISSLSCGSDKLAQVRVTDANYSTEKGEGAFPANGHGRE